jgi:hypothetical protein
MYKLVDEILKKGNNSLKKKSSDQTLVGIRKYHFYLFDILAMLHKIAIHNHMYIMYLIPRKTSVDTDLCLVCPL